MCLGIEKLFYYRRVRRWIREVTDILFVPGQEVLERAGFDMRYFVVKGGTYYFRFPPNLDSEGGLVKWEVFTRETTVDPNTGEERKEMVKVGEYRVNLVRFEIVKPRPDEKIIIKNDTDGNPVMPDLTAEVSLGGVKDINTLPFCWRVKVEYRVNTVGAPERSRKGLELSGAGKGQDGYLIPVPDPNDPTKDCITNVEPTFKIPWEDNFGGGVLEITVKVNVDGKELSTTYKGVIEGEEFNDTFKSQITSYLENPDADQTTPTIRSQVGYDKFFRVIAYLETRYRHFYPSIYGEPNGAIYPRENEGGDGGFGVMQLTDPIPTYLQIWNYKENIDRAVELIREKLNSAKTYLDKHRDAVKDVDVKRFLKMDTYQLYNGGHYWKWDSKKKKWIEKKTIYALNGERIELNIPSDF
jgi:hypothetical protein